MTLDNPEMIGEVVDSSAKITTETKHLLSLGCGSHLKTSYCLSQTDTRSKLSASSDTARERLHRLILTRTSRDSLARLR